MSLYTFSGFDQLPLLLKPQGLHIEESTDLLLLSHLCHATVANISNRLANDHVAFIAFMQGQPAAFGWMARGKASIGELNHELVLPVSNRYLWNFRTMPDYRGLGIYPALLQHIILYEQQRAERFWIIHAPENKASLRGIVKAGFRYTGDLYLNDTLQPGFKPVAVNAAEQMMIAEMGFQLSDMPAPSCWNCSSPYMKNKTAGCCCGSAGNKCTGSLVLASAS